MAKPTISVVIPALDEEGCIAPAIESVAGDAEVIVVDGHSRDRTRDVAGSLGARVLSRPASRGEQLAAGAQLATGSWLVFLHADTRLEPGWAGAIRALGGDVQAGAFRFAIDASGARYRVLEAVVALRCRLLGLPYGDQALFVRRDSYERVGGFAPWPLLEDVDLVRRLRRDGRLARLAPRAFTSARRWQRHGIVGTTARNLWILGLYAVGMSPARLARFYSAPPLPAADSSRSGNARTSRALRPF